MRALVLCTLTVFSNCGFAASFDVKGNSLATPIDVIKAKAFQSRYGEARKYDPPQISMYCNEADLEAKGFFSFRGLFFPGFASYRYNTPHDKTGSLISDETIGGYHISGIEYDTYKDKLVRMEISIDSQSGHSSIADADRIMRKALTDKFGKPASSTTWKRGGESLVYQAPDEIGYMYITIQDNKQLAAINSFLKQQCDAHKDDDISHSASDI